MMESNVPKASSHWRPTIEPVMFMYMCSTFIKFPVFQSLLYEKACLQKYGMNFSQCANVSAVHADEDLQREANHLLLVSSVCLLLPSIVVGLLLGSLCDVWSIKSTMMIPFFGLIISDFNYIFQCYFMGANVYWLLVSDLIFGFTGGFTSVIGILFAYSVKANPMRVRSERVALLEGTIGLGSTLGSSLSGFTRQRLGYTWVFVIITGMHLISILYILLFVRDLPSNGSGVCQRNDPQASPSGLRQSISRRFHEIMNVYTGQDRDPKDQRFLNMVMVALAIELIGFAGMMDILFSYLRFRLQWTDKEYGWFSGLGTGLSSVTVIFLYPILHRQLGLSNALLAAVGLVTKISNLLLLAFVSSTWLAMVSVVPLVFSRFVSTGLRSLASFYVKNHEQGKIFSFISLLEGISFLLASFIFNGLYPITLKLFPGTMLLVVAVALLVPVLLLVYIERNRSTGQQPSIEQQQQEEEEDQRSLDN